MTNFIYFHPITQNKTQAQIILNLRFVFILFIISTEH